MDIIKTYFNAEKAESLLFIGFGIFAIILSVFFFFYIKDSFWKGLAIPLVFFSIVQIVIGTTIFTRSPKDNLRVENILKYEPQKIQAEEIPRMEKVMKNFVYYRYFEIAMIVLGLILMFSISNYGFWKGFGLGLFIQCAVLLSLDFFAEKRGHFYIEDLQSINQSIKKFRIMSNNKITKHSRFNRSVYTEIVINAPIEKVWRELTNFKEMPTWSKSLQKIEGDFRKNGQTEVHFMDNKGKVGIYKHELIHFDEGKLFGWSDPFILGIKDNHKYQLEKISENQTKLIQSDQANGLATLFMGNFIMNFFLKSYTEFNQTLKKRIELKN